MKLDRAPMMVLLLLAALASAQLIHYHPLLPESVAVHFGADGAPNGWSSRTEFVLIYGAIEAFIVLFGVAFALIIDRTPANFLNIPHREYWLSDDRREATVTFLANQVLWIEAATLGFLMAIAQLVFKENLGDAPPRLSGYFWYVIVAFLGVTMWLTLRIILKFRRKD